MSDRDLRFICARLLLRPVIGFFVRKSLKLQDLVEISKSLFVEIAEDEIRKSQAESSISRVSVLTGVHRKDVTRLQTDGTKVKQGLDIVTRVLGQWQHDQRFITKAGRTRSLTCQGEQSEFWQLVRSVSREINPYTLLFEMERAGSIVKTRGLVKLKSRVYLPKGDIKQGFEFLSEDSEDLIRSVEENVFDVPEQPNLHIKTEYDKIPQNHIPEIREWFLREGSKFHQRARNYLSQFDADINPKQNITEQPVRIAIGTFSRIETVEDHGKEGSE